MIRISINRFCESELGFWWIGISVKPVNDPSQWCFISVRIVSKVTLIYTNFTLSDVYDKSSFIVKPCRWQCMPNRLFSKVGLLTKKLNWKENLIGKNYLGALTLALTGNNLSNKSQFVCEKLTMFFMSYHSLLTYYTS